ncbi:hypothetical protein JCGZ_13526 [Jatropha curcas]|uniref:Uncharacterized protein n=1 Tax=Jatropha curcas TaxID=180498 RepID=A0A067KLY2_JATCU|nr:hypothetical protein JCGZ_13526 [Jatropha curcas]
MAESSSTSSSNSLTEQEIQLLKKLSKKYEQKESNQKKQEEEPEKVKTKTATSKRQAVRARDKVNGIESISIKVQGEPKALSYADFGKIFDVPNAGSRVTKIKDVSSASLTYVNQVELCIMWHIVEKKPLHLCHIIFDKLQNNPKKLPCGMILTPVFEFLDVDLNENDGHTVSKLDSGSLKMKDEEGGEEKEKEEKKKEEKEKEEKGREETEKGKKKREIGKVKKEKERVEKEKKRLRKRKRKKTKGKQSYEK